MGKRKTKRKLATKRKETLDTQFNCVFCNHEKSIECKLEKEHKVAHLFCKVCGVKWQTYINYLSEPVDVYSDWIDACEDVNNRKAMLEERDRSYARSPRGDDIDDDQEKDDD